MSNQHKIQIELLSDATFGLGDGVAGLLDQEIEHNSATGLPFVRGRVVKGLLVEACADILYALKQPSTELQDAANYLFGTPGSKQKNDAKMQVGDATFSPELQKAVEIALHKDKENGGWLTPERILSAVTDIRRQTAVNALLDRPEEGSLRAMRVLRRGTELSVMVTCADDLENDSKNAILPLLAACCAAVQRGGTGRNRGRGRLSLQLDSAEKQTVLLTRFAQLTLQEKT